MAYNPDNPNGQAIMANSSPVTIASNQSTVKTKLATDIADVTGTITTSTSTVTMTDLSGVGSVDVTIYGTYAGVNVTFEAYDGVNWVGFPAQQHNSTTPLMVLATGTLTANSTNRWRVSPLLGSAQFRVRATAYTSGTANVIIEASAQFVQPLVNVATMPVTAVSQNGTWTVQPGNTVNTTPWLVRNTAVTTGSGLLTVKVQAAASTNATSIKASAGAIYGWALTNTTAVTQVVRMYNLAAAPTVGTSVPVYNIVLPANGGMVMPRSDPSISHSTGISYSITTGLADNDATATTANAVIGTIWYT